MIRTRFAPSPTGYAHVGSIRTALFAFLVARQANGKFVLRLEDTDKNREVEGSEAHLVKSLRDLGLDYDEGPDIGGPFAPYRQSERLDSYKKWAEKLISVGRAYADPYTPEQVQKFREDAERTNRPFRFRDHRPDDPPEWQLGMPLRFKSEPKTYRWHDEVMGDLSAGADSIDDFILIKSDGYPTYNFAHIVDDAEMEISHIIRGQEFIASTPNYLNLYEALDLQPPIFATMPHILNETGNKKLGKRDGAKDVLEYFSDGYLQETMVNFIASLGWNDGTEQEIFSLEKLINKFALSRVQRSGARFDEKRLVWMNGQWIKRLELDDLLDRVQDFWGEAGSGVSVEEKRTVLAVVQDRLKTLADLPALTEYFFTEPTANWQMIDDNKQLGKLSRDEQL
ncbi:MAG: glutamate--tRNA ligase, partial [Candidatus Nomurabacteria bacterium]|nr:glutamate--tRNA ligase [Candidatus Nomurabacteria bacterium]